MDNELAIPAASIESRTIRKLRIRIIPFLFLLYIVAYLDRINIGFAALIWRSISVPTGQPIVPLSKAEVEELSKKYSHYGIYQ